MPGIIDAPGSNIANSASFAVTQTINMIKPGGNSFSVEVYLDADPSTIIDSDFASIEVTANPVSNNLLTPGFTQVVRQQIVDLELGAIGAVTGASTATFTVTLGGVDFTTTVASSQESIMSICNSERVTTIIGLHPHSWNMRTARDTKDSSSH